jgi:hypothetical protein
LLVIYRYTYISFSSWIVPSKKSSSALSKHGYVGSQILFKNRTRNELSI